jgi:hypothetical protein
VDVTEREIFWALLWGDGEHRHEVQLRYEGERVVCWIPCHHRERLTRLLDYEDCFVSAVPRGRRHDSLSWGPAHMLWAFFSRPDSCRRLERFRPAPTLVWREGRSSRRWAAWGLSAPLSPAFVQQATERLSHYLGGLRKAGRPDALIASPFSGRWAVEFHQPETYTPRQIVGGLRDAPDPHQWKAAA